MAIFLRQSTASQEVPLGYFVDATDGNTEETGLTIANTDIKIWKTGATTLANKNSGGATHISNGIYDAVLDATDTDTIGPLVLFVHVAGALSVRLECCVLDEAVYDVLFGTTALTTGGALTVTSGRVHADVTHIATATVNTSLAQLGVNVVQAAGTAWGSGAITAASLASNAITAAKIATDAIDADALAADAVTEIQSGLSTLDAASVRAAVGLAAANLDTQLTAIDDVLDTEIAAIKAKTDNLPSDPADASDIAASCASLASTLSTIAAYLDTEVAAIKAKTDTLPASPAATGDAMTLSAGERTSLADALLTRDWTAVSGEAARSLLNALRFLRNKWSLSGTTLTVTKEDDTTAAWTSTVTTNAAADPITGSDPA